MDIMYRVQVIRDGEVLEQDYASGNTERTAKAAAEGLGRQIANFYEGAHYVIKKVKRHGD